MIVHAFKLIEPIWAVGGLGPATRGCEGRPAGMGLAAAGGGAGLGGSGLQYGQQGRPTPYIRPIPRYVVLYSRTKLSAGCRSPDPSAC
jgi:hypothetical protein